jgi:hypothetical protein
LFPLVLEGHPSWVALFFQLDQILRLGLRLLNHQTRIAPTTTKRIVSFIWLDIIDHELGMDRDEDLASHRECWSQGEAHRLDREAPRTKLAMVVGALTLGQCNSEVRHRGRSAQRRWEATCALRVPQHINECGLSGGVGLDHERAGKISPPLMPSDYASRRSRERT